MRYIKLQFFIAAVILESTLAVVGIESVLDIRCELLTLKSQIIRAASYPETSAVVDFLRPLLLRLTVWR